MVSLLLSKALASYLFLASLSSAHSHIAYLIINNNHYRGFDPSGRTTNAPNVVGWSTTGRDDGFVPPSNYSTPDIICHRDGAPGKAHAPVKQGDNIHVQWNGWPLSHSGPVMSYLAPCSNLNTTDGCGSVDKTQLRWTKIDNSSPAFINDVSGPPGEWATDLLIASNNSWLVGIPSNLEPGPYVLRHEIIALHYANKNDGAQNYPQCVNLWVEDRASQSTGVRAADPIQTTVPKSTVVSLLPGAGTPASNLYKPTDPGVSIDIYRTLSTYVIPGPTVAPWAAPVPLRYQMKMSTPLTTGTPISVEGTRTVPFPAAETGV